VWLLIELWAIALTVVVALILVGTLNPFVARLQRRGMKRGWAVLWILLVLLVVASLLLLLTLPPLFDQMLELLEDAPAKRDAFIGWLNQRPLTAPMADLVRDLGSEKMFATVGSALLSFSSEAALAIGYGATAIVLAFYILLEGQRSQAGLYAIVPRSYHLRLARIMLELEVIVGGYVRGQLITSAAITIFAFALLTAFQVPNALPLAVFAGLTDVIPFIGGALATTPAVIGGLAVSPTVALIIAAVMLSYQEFESRYLVPKVYGRVLRLSATTVILALLIGGTLLGILGALLALPISAGLLMIARELRVELPGDDSDDGSLRARDRAAEATYAKRSAGASPEAAVAIATEMARARRKGEAIEPALAGDTRAGDPPLGG
jgi:predicted PurR-regulated permease PerM